MFPSAVASAALPRLWCVFQPHVARTHVPALWGFQPCWRYTTARCIPKAPRLSFADIVVLHSILVHQGRRVANQRLCRLATHSSMDQGRRPKKIHHQAAATGVFARLSGFTAREIAKWKSCVQAFQFVTQIWTPSAAALAVRRRWCIFPCPGVDLCLRSVTQSLAQIILACLMYQGLRG